MGDDGHQALKEFGATRERILKAPVYKTLAWLAWPVIVVNLVNLSYNLVDAIWLGRLGREAFSAPTVCWPPIMLVYSIALGYASAGLALISQYAGAGDVVGVRKSAGQLFLLAVIFGLIISVVGFISAPYILTAMGVPPDVYPLALSYMRVIFAGVPLTIPAFGYNAIANSLGDTKTPMKLNVASSILNIILDPILIFGLLGMPALGVVGAAVATISSRALTSVVGAYLVFVKGVKGIRVERHDMRLEGWWLRKIFSIGSPLALQQSANALGFTIMMSIVSRFGSTVIAAFGVAQRIISIMQAFAGGFFRAASIMIGQTIGAEAYARAKEVVKKSLILISGSFAIGSTAIIAFRVPLILIFVNDPKVIPVGSRLLEVFAPSIPFFGMFFLCSAVANGSGHTKFFAALSIFRLWVLRIGLSVALAYFLGMGTDGVWYAMTTSNIAAGALALAWLSRGTWLSRVIEVPPERITNIG